MKEKKQNSLHWFSASLYSARKRALPPMSHITGHDLFSHLHSVEIVLQSFYVIIFVRAQQHRDCGIKQQQQKRWWNPGFQHQVVVYYKSHCTCKLADIKQQMHLQCDEASLPQRVTDLKCYSQNIDGIFNLVMDVLLHQLLAHPQTQTAHSNAPEWQKLLFLHLRIIRSLNFIRCIQKTILR